jgi:molybdate transport system substrate-binding protein
MSREADLSRAALIIRLVLVATACSGTPAPTLLATQVAATPFVTATSLPDTRRVPRPALPTPVVATPPTSSAGATGDITIFAATSLTDLLTALGAAFTKDNPNAYVISVYANSATLAGELEQRAKADVFASAHPTTMARVGAIVGSIETLARTSLIVVTPVDNPAHIGRLQDLANPGVKVVTADPSDAVAQYTQTMFQKVSADPLYGSDFLSKVQHNVLSQRTNQRDMLMAVLLGQGDAAILYTTDLTPERRYRLNPIVLPDALTTPVILPIAVARGDNAAGGQAFVKFVLSNVGQDLVADHGFVLGDRQRRRRDDPEYVSTRPAPKANWPT